ncbi:hypothetical protein SCORR_v1c05480 [Spiroplasma corruscae]|uniref:MOLPALP family lipoprotein n=1 Tax=Spiroplasma corruscae TaxID=216934 RepID=A0A222EP99_9MOLU|nr:hypothetical protein [Spiroplasma corruscae]ASP28320.1 hypothetical protein SCORR_v1c05480 [Spiroplasma corruscae]
MKKLISLIGILTITTSSLTVVTSCGETYSVNFDNSDDQSNISKLLTQYSKSLYLNQNETETDSETNKGLGKVHYSSSYLMNDIVKNNYLSNLGLKDFKNIDTNEYSRFSDVSQKYFKNSTNFVSNQTTVDDSIYQDGVIAPEINGTASTITSLVGSLPMILNMLSKPESFAPLMSMLANKFSDLISTNLLKTLGNILTNDVLKDLEKAFSIDAYKDDQGEFFSYEDAMSASIIALSNSFDKLINKDSTTTALTYKNSDDINKNINEASKSVAVNLMGLINGTKSFSFDILTDASVIPNILFFVRTLLVYLNSAKVDNFSSKVLTMKDINQIRIKKLSSDDNVFDFKNVVSLLSFITEDTDKKGSTVLQNLFGLLLGTPNDDAENQDNGDWTNLSKSYSGNKNGLINIVSQLAVSLAGEKVKIYFTDPLIRSFINWGFGTTSSTLIKGIMALIPQLASLLPEMIKNIVTNIGEDDWNKYFIDPGKYIGYLYDNNNTKLNLSIKKMLSEPLENIFNSSLFGLGSSNNKEKVFDNQKDLGFGFLTSSSVKEIVSNLSSKVNGDKDNEFIIKFDTFSTFFKSLYTNDNLKTALSDPNNLFKHLGLNEDGTIKEDSPLSILKQVVKENLGWLKAFVNTINDLINSYKDKLSQVRKTINSKFNDLEVTYEINGTNDFVYNVTDKITSNVNKFEIVLTYEGNYLTISKMKLLSN